MLQVVLSVERTSVELNDLQADLAQLEHRLCVRGIPALRVAQGEESVVDVLLEHDLSGEEAGPRERDRDWSAVRVEQPPGGVQRKAGRAA